MKLVKRKAFSFVLAIALALGLVGVMPGMAAKAETAYTLDQLRSLMGSYEWESLNGDIIKVGEGDDFIGIKKKGASDFTYISKENFDEPYLEEEGVVGLETTDGGYIEFSIDNLGNLYNFFFGGGEDGEILSGVTRGDYFKNSGYTCTLNSLRDLIASGFYTSISGNKIDKTTGSDFIRYTSADNKTIKTISMDKLKIVYESNAGGVTEVDIVVIPDGVADATAIEDYEFIVMVISDNSIPMIKVTSNRGVETGLGVPHGMYDEPGTPIIDLSDIKLAFTDNVSYTSRRGHTIKKAAGSTDFIMINNGISSKNLLMSDFKITDFFSWDNSSEAYNATISYKDNDTITVYVNEGKVSSVSYWGGDNLDIDRGDYVPPVSITKDELFNKIPASITFNGYTGDKINKGSDGESLIVTNVSGDKVTINKSGMWLKTYYFESWNNSHIVYAEYYVEGMVEEFPFSFTIDSKGVVSQIYVGDVTEQNAYFEKSPFGILCGPYRSDIIPNTEYPPIIPESNQGVVYFVQWPDGTGKEITIGLPLASNSYHDFCRLLENGKIPLLINGKYYHTYTRGSNKFYRLENSKGQIYFTFDEAEFYLLKNLRGWSGYDTLISVNEPFNFLDKINPRIDLRDDNNTPVYTPADTPPTTQATTTQTPAREVEIPVSGDAASKVDIKVSGDTAVIGDISLETISAAVSDLADKHVSLNLSNQRGVTAATLPKSTLENIANSDASVGLEIRFAGGNIKLDTAALSELAEKADGDDITISIKTVTTTELNKAQSDAFSGVKIEIVVRPEIKVGNKPISYERNENSAGIMTLFLPYNLQAGQRGEFLHVYYVNDYGILTRHNTSYGSNGVSFTTTHNSYYVVVYDESYSNKDFLNIFRAYNPETGDHLFTNNRNEYNLVIKNGWNAEGIAFDVNKNGGKAVHRLYNPITGEHFYTASVKEKDNCVKDGWMYEGKTFASAGDTKVYRLYNPNSKAGAHVFTTDEREYNVQSQSGLIGEGVVFMVY